jgi:dolichyl-phosphate-mannose-protein mannosyltransferase
MGLNGVAVRQLGEEVSTDLYQIAQLLRAGANDITLSSVPWSHVMSGLFVDGFVMNRGVLHTFGSDSGWTVTPPARTTSAQNSGRPGAIALPENGPLPAKRVLTTLLPLTYTARQAGKLFAVSSLTMGLTFIVWKGTSRFLSGLRQTGPDEASRADALAHLPTLLILGTLYLLSFDVRVDPTFPFSGITIWLSGGALLIFRALLVLQSLHSREPSYHDQRHSLAADHSTRHYLCAFGLLALIGVGALLRFHGLDTQSLYHDEIHLLSFVKGLLAKGYPYKMLGPVEIPLSTYELVPYPIALSAKLLGFNDFAVRLPAALFGVMTIPLIYFIGHRAFDRRVGLLAAAIYTFCPQALIWAKYLWHPQQVQFFALLTSYLFYRAICRVPMSPPYLYLAGASFILTYLSWEGAGFLLPALGVGLVVIQRKNLAWTREKHLWINVAIVGVAIVLQLCRRIMLQLPYLVIGTGLSDVSLPTLYFLDPMYDPTFYLKNFLWLENNVLLTLFFMVGLPLFWNHSALSYYRVLLISILLMMTNTLPHATIRYAYYIQPFLIMSSVSTIVYILDYSLQIFHSHRFYFNYRIKNLVTIVIISLLILGGSPFLKWYRLTGFSIPSGIHTRSDAYYIDYRSPARYLKSHYRDGDLVIAVAPTALSYYTDIEAHYFVQDYTFRQVLYDPSEFSLLYLERTAGKPTLSDFNAFREALSSHRRTWVVAVPYGVLQLLFGSDIVEFIDKWGRVVYESYNARIYLLGS